MKRKLNILKNVKSIIYVLVVITIIVIVDLWFFRAGSKMPSVWAHFALLVSAVICYCVFSNDKDDEVEAKVVAMEEMSTFFGKREMNEHESISTDIVTTLKWSSLMKDVTWDRAQELIHKKGRGWRFPTKEEFYNRVYFFPFEERYWLDDRRVYSKSFHKEVIATINVKAHLYLVREV